MVMGKRLCYKAQRLRLLNMGARPRKCKILKPLIHCRYIGSALATVLARSPLLGIILQCNYYVSVLVTARHDRLDGEVPIAVATLHEPSSHCRHRTSGDWLVLLQGAEAGTALIFNNLKLQTPSAKAVVG
ncbi:hypothetical protein EJ04DRAFT_294475 [Polyplosphaeria fusca]|uniref:Uncharacterized protein n=1 Tax=Polyplosphaeria fusca TaxID=682080 RepID=A0A9P4R6H2_9PLEO|nr:hypothetical protein EJ04DRAFT_294475 [Polyplosphaeria fusca]